MFLTVQHELLFAGQFVISSLRPMSPLGPALLPAGKGIPRLHLPLGCGALGQSKMKHGPINKQIEPEGGHRVDQGFRQGQRSSPLGQGTLQRRAVLQEEEAGRSRGALKASLTSGVMFHF